MTVDYQEELLNVAMSTRIRWLMVLIDAGEIDEKQADELRRLPEPETMREAA